MQILDETTNHDLNGLYTSRLRCWFREVSNSHNSLQTVVVHEYGVGPGQSTIELLTFKSGCSECRAHHVFVHLASPFAVASPRLAIHVRKRSMKEAVEGILP